MNHKLTTEQLFALDKGETNVRELFPDLFQMKVGGYYGFTDEPNMIFCITEFSEKGHPIGFGFWNKKFSSDRLHWCRKEDETVKPLTPEELQTFAKMLESEAVERGYKEGVRVKCLKKERIHTIRQESCVYQFETKELWYGGACIFKNGIWAKILT